jgi:Na+:H+ antiporter, NhaA family
VIDDLGAIVVIAIFYSSGISASGLLVAALGFSGVFAMQRLGVRTKLAYVVPSVVAWAGIYAAGIHPTIAGVIVGLITPVTAWLGPDGFVVGARQELEQLAQGTPNELSSHELAGTLHKIDVARREAMSPAESLIEALHPWVAFGIMPLFALANAGVTVSAESLDATSWSVVTAVAAGLVLGKPVGILLSVWLTRRLGIGVLPKGMTWRHVVVLGVVAGVGFTMALFIAQLAFSDADLLAAAKLGVLGASGGAALLGLVLGRILLAPREVLGTAQTADEAERSTEA